MANLIQSYVNRPASQDYKKPKPDFDIRQELDNRTFIKPLKAKGRLVNNNLQSVPSNFVKNIVYNTKAFKHAILGNANDHELGKMNDIGLLVGGLSIAGYLATKRQTPLTKGMEFIGLGSFLTSMALWPKIAIQLPAYLIHGVNVHQKYQDSFGRRKPFYQDPQFIPWDLYTDEQIDKIGNRLGVDKNIPNRREFVQERMKKLAIQNNTLWMLTAGFATPVMSALICNQLEPYIENYLTDKEIKKADGIMSNLDEYSKKYRQVNIPKSLDRIFEQHKNKPLNQDLIKLISDTFVEDIDFVTSESVKKDLRRYLLADAYKLDLDSAKEITSNIKLQLSNSGIDENLLREILPDEKMITKIFNDGDWFSKTLTQNDFRDIDQSIMHSIYEKLENIDLTPFGEEKEDLREFISGKILSNHKNEHPIKKVLSKKRANLFNENLLIKLKGLGSIFDEMRSIVYSFDDYVVKKTSAASKKSAMDVLDLFGIKPKDIEKLKFSEDLVGQLLRERMEDIVSDRSKYQEFIEKVVKKIETLASTVSRTDMETYNEKVTIKLKEFAHKFKTFEGMSFYSTADALVGDGYDLTGTYLKVQKDFLSDKMTGMKSAFMRLISGMDLFKRAVTSANTADAIKGYPREIREEIVELCKIIALNGHMSDFATKFYMKRNPNPNIFDMEPIEIVDGKIKYKYLGKISDTVNIPNDKYFYQNALRFLYEAPMDLETLAVVNKSASMKDEIIRYREEMFDVMGSDRYFARPEHLTRPSKYTGSKYKFLLTGVCPQENFFKACQNTLNTKKWLKIFGTFGAVLFGATVFAQFFLGKIKSSEGKR